MNIKITADSTCDLPAALLQQYNISILPLYIVKEGVSLRDGLEIEPKDIFDHVDYGGTICSTAAVNVADYIDCFSNYAKDYDAIIHINIGSGFSSCYQNARIAASEFDNVYPIDSSNLSSGMGQLVLEACELSKQDMAIDELLSRLHILIPKIEASFILNSLSYLQKGGRCSAVVSLGANLLNLKPCIEVKDGAMGVGKKYRGSFERSAKHYVEERLLNRDDIREDRIIFVHTGCPDNLVTEIRTLLTQKAPQMSVIEATAGCTISNHCGPMTLGVMFCRK